MSGGVLGRFSLRGRGALVTGAARGLGAAMALALAEAGADVVALDVEPLDGVEREITERGVRCATRELDLRGLEPEAAAELMAWSRERHGDLSVLVNNAGMIRRAPAAETTAADWHDVIGLNLTAPFFLAQAFGRQLLREGARGSIVNVVSMNSFQGGMEVPAYTASKHGLLGITRALANEWTAHGIRVNGIAPGWMATDLTTALREDPARDQALLARMPIGHWGEPSDLAGAVVYLASDASSYVSGTFIAVDGGWLAR
jgi:2-dehydro-3-deoxy-D-gluconate 5-dehydrogenase